MVWDELYLGAEEMAANCDVEPSIPCLCVAQRHCMSVPADLYVTPISAILLAGGGGVGGRLTAPPSDYSRV